MDGHRADVEGGRRSLSGKGNFLGDIAVLAVSAIISGASPAEAATSIFWPDYYQPAPPPRIAPPHIRKSTRHRALPGEDVAKDARKPQGPLVIAISIDRQILRIYDANGYFAETPISTGMRGHSTPMGVFSVIQKHKYHRSNIYSGAPMPYMQRITWSGVAMHAGVLPGYPASHGCIRMPMNFAVKMWGWTRMGARVVIAPGELTPEAFAHPLLVAQKVVPLAAAEPNNDIAVTAKSDKEVAITPAFSEASLGLKSTVGHDLAKPDASEAAVSLALREQTHTADASSALSQPTISDATSSARSPVAKADDEAAMASDAPAEETKATEAASKPVQPAETDVSEKADAESVSVEVQSPSQPVDERAKTELPASEGVKADSSASEAAKIEAADVKADAPKSDTPTAIDKPQKLTDEPLKPADAGAIVKKDQARPSDTAAPRPEPTTAAAPKRTGQIAVFVSRKDGKLYVRQNFSPLFEVPVTIAPSDRPLGTHVFTAQTDKDDANLLHWSVISMPVLARNAARQDDDERVTRRRKTTGAIEVKPAPAPDTAAEALDRLTIPADAMARISEALSTGGSIIVSDQGINAGETGEGTDFIVLLR